MSSVKFDLAIIFNNEEVLEVIIGKGNGLLKKIKESDHWDSLEEECWEEQNLFETIDELKSFFDKNNSQYSVRIDIKKDIYYKV